MSKLMILFPGVNYGVDCPLLYYGRLQYEGLGYENFKIDYQAQKGEGLDALVDFAYEAAIHVKAQVQKVNLEEYEEIVFVSKSIGTVIACWLEDELALKNVMHVMLTPIDLTLPYMERDRNYRCIVTGLKDKYVNHEELRALCEKKGVSLTEFEGVGHRLERRGDIKRNLEILTEVVNLY
ncbi:MAG: hypothetical protein ACI4C1_08460 [Lachnospiraceae bacterium]